MQKKKKSLDAGALQDNFLFLNGCVAKKLALQTQSYVFNSRVVPASGRREFGGWKVPL